MGKIPESIQTPLHKHSVLITYHTTLCKEEKWKYEKSHRLTGGSILADIQFFAK